MTERQVVERVARFFAEKGHVVACEVPFFERRIDLVALSPTSGEVTVVEAKVRDWRKGIAQLLLAQAGAHVTYLAVAQRSAERVPVGLIRACEIGLMAVDGRAHIAIEGLPIRHPNPYCVEILRRAVAAAGRDQNCP